MTNRIAYYYDEEKSEKVGVINAYWNYNIFIGDDVWINC